MNNVVAYLKSIDYFGAPLVQQIDKDQSIYKSILGGIMTLLIFSSSLFYAIWVYYQWQMDQFSPKISSSVYLSNFELLDINYDVIRVRYWKYDETFIDPFESKVLIPLVIYTENFTLSDPAVLSLSNQTSYDGNKFIIPQMKLGFSTLDGVIMTTSEMYILLVKCSTDLLKEGEECASEEISNQFFSQPQNTIILQFQYKLLNSKDGSVQTSKQDYYIQIEQQNCYSFSTFLQSTLYEVRDSLLFGNPSYYEFLSGATIQPQTNSVAYCQLAYGYETYSVMYIVMKGNQSKTIFEYPNAGDLLANIGSIVSILFMVRHIMILLNSYFLNEKILHDLISFYYPQFSQIKIQRNWKRNITKVELNKEVLDTRKFQQFYKSVKDKMEIKFTFINLLYELSRLYILFRSIMRRDDIRKCHQVGLKMDFLKLNHAFLVEPNLNSLSSKRDIDGQTLEEDDIGFISLNERFNCLRNGMTEEEGDLVNFFDINRVVQ